LPLRHHWKQVAKRAHQRAFDSQDVIDSICPALERDWWWEVPNEFMNELRNLCSREAPSLFGDELDRLKHAISGRGTLCNILVQCTADALAEGKSGLEALGQAVRHTLHDRLLRNARQMEEHYLREVGLRRAADVRSRLANAITRASIDTLANKLTSQPASPNATPPKHQGIDDGVGLQ